MAPRNGHSNELNPSEGTRGNSRFSLAGSSSSLNDGKEGAGEEVIKHVQNKCPYFFTGLRLPFVNYLSIHALITILSSGKNERDLQDAKIK